MGVFECFFLADVVWILKMSCLRYARYVGFSVLVLAKMYRDAGEP